MRSSGLTRHGFVHFEYKVGMSSRAGSALVAPKNQQYARVVFLLDRGAERISDNYIPASFSRISMF